MYNPELIYKKYGKDVRIDVWARISRPELVEIGNHVAIDMGVYISVAAKIGDYIHIAPHACIIGGAAATLIMEDFTNIAAGCKLVVISDDFTDGLINPLVPLECKRLIGSQIIMRRFSVIGVNSVVLPNVIMAEGSALGANSLLTKSTEPWTIYGGSPAKPIGMRKKELILASARKMGY